MSVQACTPDVVRSQVAIEEFTLRPDGDEVVYVRRHVEGLEYRSHLWSVPYAGGAPRQLTSGSVRDSSPAYSPDGTRLAFIRTAEGAEHGQPFVLEPDSPEPRALHPLKHGASSVSWSPDGALLAVLAASDDVPFIVGPEVPGKQPLARRITRLDWRDDDAGHRDRKTHLFLLPVDGSAPARQLTSGDWDVSNPAWSPDSGSIAFATDLNDERDLDPRSSIYVVDIAGGEPRLLAELAGDADYPAWSPRGDQIAFLGRDTPDAPEYVTFEPWLIGADGTGQRPLRLTADGMIGTWAWSELDLIDGWPGPSWLDDDTLVCLVAERARCVPHSVATGGGSYTRLVDDDRVLASGLAVEAGCVVFSATVDGRAGEIYAAKAGRMRRLTSDGSDWQGVYHLPQLQEVEVPGPGGPINTWIASPPDAGDAAMPTIVHFHGGPTGSFGPGSSLDAMVLTSAGYRVVMPNIRGSATFGRDWAHALSGRWGEVDAEDALAVVDWLIAEGLSDARRIGVYGLSYGGFMVQWLVGTTDRFTAAVAENGVANQVSTWASSYFGVYWDRRMGLADPLSHEGMLKLWSSSPLSQAANIHTPLLMLQAEDDLVCPPADNEQLFTALRALRRTVEYVLYPEEHHEMKTYGRPDRRIDRLERMLDWFTRYMGPNS